MMAALAHRLCCKVTETSFCCPSEVCVVDCAEVVSSQESVRVRSEKIVVATSPGQ